MLARQSLTQGIAKPRIPQMNLRKQLLLYIEARDITASQLARKAGVPKQTVSRWLGGQSPKDISQVKSVADVLKTSVDNLCFGSGLEKASEKTTDLSTLIGDEWVSGLFEVKLRRIKGGQK